MALCRRSLRDQRYDNRSDTVCRNTCSVCGGSIFLLPSANKMADYLASIIHNGVVIKKVGEQYVAIRDLEVKTAKEENYKKVTLDKEIKVEDMTFHYPDTEDAVLAHVNVTIRKTSPLHLSDRRCRKDHDGRPDPGVLKPQAGKIR